MAERNLQTERAAESVIKRHYDKVLQRWSGLQMFFWCEKNVFVWYGTQQMSHHYGLSHFCSQNATAIIWIINHVLKLQAELNGPLDPRASKPHFRASDVRYASELSTRLPVFKLHVRLKSLSVTRGVWTALTKFEVDLVKAEEDFAKVHHL